MFRLLLTYTKNPHEFSIFTSSICKQVLIRCFSQDSNYAIIRPLNYSSVFEHGTKLFLLNTKKRWPIRTFAHHYTTNAAAVKSDHLKRLDNFVKQLKDCVSNGNYLTHKDIRTLSQLLKTERANDDQALDILRLCSFDCINHNATEQVQSIWMELKDHVQFNTEHFNYLLQFISRTEDVIQTQKIFDELIEDGLQPDALSYQCLLSVYCKCGNIEKSLEIINKMKQNNILIDECSYNYLIQCNIVCGNITVAVEEITNLKENGHEIDQNTLKALLSHYATTGDVRGVDNAITVFKETNKQLLNRDILKVMCESSINGNSNVVDFLFHHLESNDELEKSLLNATQLFVVNGQSTILPKIIQLTAKTADKKQMYAHLINEMVQHCTSESEFNETIKLIEASGFPLDKNFELFKPVLKGCSIEMIKRFLQYMKTHQIEMKQIAFVKLIELSAEKSVDDVIEVVNLMIAKYRVKPQPAFLRDVILPALKADNDPTALSHLRKTKIPIQIIVKALINSCLNRCDFKAAINYLNSYDFFDIGHFTTVPLLHAYAKTGDVQHFVQIVKLIERNFSQIRNNIDADLTDAEIESKRLTFIGDMLYLSIENAIKNSHNLTKLLKMFIAKNLKTSSNQIRKIQYELLRVNAQSQIGDLLKKLSIEKVQLESMHFRQNRHDQNSAELEILLQYATGITLDELRKRLFIAYTCEGNIEKVESMMAKYDMLNTKSDYAHLIELYAGIGNLKMALQFLQEVRLKYPSFKLNPPQAAQIVTLMFENNSSFNEIDNFLHTYRPQQDHDRMIPFAIFLQRVADSGNTHLLDQLFNTLERLNYIKASTDTTAALISVRLNNGAYIDAVDKFEHLAKTYNILPMSTFLFIKLIRKNQIDLLERAYNIYKMVYGESDGASRLAFAFIDCGLDEKAKLIFQSVHIDDLTKYVRIVCKIYLANDDIKSAKLLLKSTHGSSCDRRIIYQTILDICRKQNMTDEALELWNIFANDDTLPPYNFITKLMQLLEANNIEIPTDLLLNSK